MSSAHAFRPDLEQVDQRVYLHDIAWDAYEALLEARGEGSVPRITYLEGTIELMAPSLNHEKLKSRLGRLLETWLQEHDLVYEGYGSWTVKREDHRRGAEADECYVLGEHDPERLEHPDIAIEVVWTSGGIDKLEVWRELGTREVWIWESGMLTFHVLQGTSYVAADHSKLLPTLDPALLLDGLDAPSQSAAVRQLRTRLQRG